MIQINVRLYFLSKFFKMKFRNLILMSVAATCFASSALADGPDVGSAQAYPMMSWPEYLSKASDVEARLPYMLKIHTPHGGLRYFGSVHSHRPRDPQLSEIEALWKQFDPQIALVEGGIRSVAKTKNEAIENDGEAGLITYLAARGKIHLESIDPEPAQEIAELRKTFPAEQLKIFYILRYIPTYRRMPKPRKTLDEYLKDGIDAYSRYGLEGPPNSTSELESIFARFFPGKGSYKDPDDCQTDPACFPGTFLNEISRASSEYRDRFMVNQISRFVCQKRVFAVVGWSHIVMQEPALKKLVSDKCR